ncbi:hypothetical protein QUF76_03895 [Desulfobacterales bacterium HSG16]|nr:hypothetical protein [Desulfobacterales bacterium HSG16]
MSGLQEILIILVVGLALFYLPVRKKNNTPSRMKVVGPAVLITGRTRLFVFLSVLWPAGAAFFLKPWQHDLLLFIYIGIGPIVLCWGLWWVIMGFKDFRR